MTDADEERDAAIVAAVGRGDQDAFDEFYVRYLPLVVRWAVRETRNREVAADLTAEMFAAALTAARRFRPERGRRIGAEPVLLADADLDRVEELASLDENVIRLLEGLPATLRQALTERVLHERSYEEIAAELSCSESVVRQRVSRALKTLRSQMEET
jgi:DNA-directed RNA polymerase specialized sigma24 family protein